MPFFSDYGHYHHHGPSAPFSSQYYSQLLQPHLHHGGVRPVPRMQPRNYNSIVVEQTLRAIRRGPGAAATATRHRYAAPHRPVHINASEIDVTSPRRPARRPPVVPDEAADDGGGDCGGGGGGGGGGGIQRGRTVVRLHTVHKKAAAAATADGPRATDAPQPPVAMPAVPEEGVAKKGTIKRHTSAGIKVPVDVNDDRRPSMVTDEILREQEALFDTMIMEEMEGGGGGGGVLKKPRRKSYPADVVAAAADGGKKKVAKGARKKSAADAALFGGDADRIAKKAAATATANWKLNYDVIIEESGVEPPVSYTFKLNKAKKEGGGRGDSKGKQLVDANHNVVISDSLHDNDDRRVATVKKHAKVISVKKNAPAVNNDKSNNDKDNSVGMLSSAVQQNKPKKKVIVKKKVIKKKEASPADGQLQPAQQQSQSPAKPPQTPSPADSKSKKKKKKTSPVVSKTATTSAAAAAAVPAVITPFVRASFGKTFISPSQVSSTKSKFEKPKPKAKPEVPEPVAAEPAPEMPLARESPVSSDDDDDDDTSSTDDSSSVCSGNETESSDSSTYYYSDDYGDKRIACSVSSFDSGLPSSPVPTPDPIGRKRTVTATIIYYFTNIVTYDNNIYIYNVNLTML